MNTIKDPNDKASFITASSKALFPLWVLLVFVIWTLPLAAVAGGVYLAYRGVTADTKFNLFGNEFSSTSVGVSIAFVGGVMFVLCIRRLLCTIDSSHDHVARY